MQFQQPHITAMFGTLEALKQGVVHMKYIKLERKRKVYLNKLIR